MLDADWNDIIYYLVTRNNPLEIYAIWHANREKFQNHKMIISLKDNHKPSSFNNVLFHNTEILPYFQPGQLFFFDYNSFSTSDNAILDYSVTMDSNYASRIYNFINELEHKSVASVIDVDVRYKTLDTLVRHDLNYDAYFYLFENYYNSIISGDGVFRASDTRHRAIWNTLVSIEKFKNINRLKYITQDMVEFEITNFQAQQNADEIIHQMYCTETGKKMMDTVLQLFYQNMLFIIGMFSIQFNGKASVLSKMKQLMNYMQETVGIYPERELFVAYHYFTNSNHLKEFHKINIGHKGMKIDDLQSKIENVTWDLMAPRVMEYLLMASQEINYVPFFLSHDSGLNQFLRLFNIRGIYQDINTNKATPIPDMITARFYESLGLGDYLRSFIANKKRFNVAQNNISNGFSMIEEKLRELHHIMSTRSSGGLG